MIPALVSSDIRQSIVEYLSTTFAIGDEETREALAQFLADGTDGIFRGPYLRVRTPLRPVGADWRNPLGWMPSGFVPFKHQAQAFERLSSFGRGPLPTIVTTGTGSGKTECFLYPVIDHCVRDTARGRRGVKALLLYPMNALATDQAGRLAKLIHDDPNVSGITAGLYIGEEGKHRAMGADHLIDHKPTLQGSPPDILLTNYKMLDFLLLRETDRELWADNDPDTLRYVVLDEFHSYDGAQGTDVAMLLRRLGARLGMATAGRPLGVACPVATSATLGSDADDAASMREFATRVFGTEFDDDTLIDESRLDPAEACGAINFALPIPEIDDVLALADDDHDDLAALFTGVAAPLTPVRLGELLLPHPLTRGILSAVGDRPTEFGRAVEEFVRHAPNWGRVLGSEPERVARALVRFLSLLSIARRTGQRPLFTVEVQLWVREVSRLLRVVDSVPSFRWLDAGSAVDEEEEPASALPAIYCRHCGRTGWMAVVSDLDGTVRLNVPDIYSASVEHSPRVRALIRASEHEVDVRFLEIAARRLHLTTVEDSVAVLVTAGEEQARRSECPSCGNSEGIRFLGSQIASLASVTINQLFGSPWLDAGEHKLLAFTDSVQDASHRASFFASRTHRFNLRTFFAGAVVDEDPVPLDRLAGDVIAGASPDDRYALVPPDLLRVEAVREFWTAGSHTDAWYFIAKRLQFEADLELGLRARLGRTLELTGSVACAVTLRDPVTAIELLSDAYEHLVGTSPISGPTTIEVYLRGLLERLRLQGAIAHPWLERYIKENGNHYFVWGKREDGMPAFTSDMGRPSFVTTAKSSQSFDRIAHLSATPTWWVDWAVRGLDLQPSDARDFNVRAFGLLAEADELAAWDVVGGAQVYGLSPDRVFVHDVCDDGDSHEPSLLRCDVCSHRHAAPNELIDRWVDTPCLRYRCPGRYAIALLTMSNYYRRLYRSRDVRRVVTAEHTGLLKRDEREDVEERFKHPKGPDDPNVLTCTPTLELGIDIGDLSAVVLASVPPRPASYLQRIGRAGRRSGNALSITFAGTDRRSLYYLAEPAHMLAGEVRPPSCYLDAIEILRRQYLAFLLDRIASGHVTAPPMPHQIGPVVRTGLDTGGWLRSALEIARGAAPIDEFLALFAGHVSDEAILRMRAWAGGDLELAIKQAFEAWRARYRELELRRDRLKTRIETLEGKPHRETDEDIELRTLRGERAAIAKTLRTTREDYTLSALEGLGLLPNYTLGDEAVRLTATLWSHGADDEYRTDEYEYDRAASIALSEFAPGASFYAGGHKLVIDALEIGASSEPEYEHWRLCPECAYGAVDDPTNPPLSCPRCHRPGIVDAGARHQMLRLRAVLSHDSEENARVYDERDERDRRPFSTITTTDVDPGEVTRAWQHDFVTFGMELAPATIRTVNFGDLMQPGEEIDVAGRELRSARFRTCRYCGVVDGARNRRGHDQPRHRGWCLTRGGNRKEQWDDLVLYHQYRTEAVRLLLPVATFEVGERLASFKGALALGLRLDFGGEPEHLRVLTTDAPGSGGAGRRRFLVLHDTVPGGTGYLGRIADPDRLHEILAAARRAIVRCPCRNEGKVACHRCLLGGVEVREIELVSRATALELLDELLTDWHFTPVPTIGEMEIAAVEESELERLFKATLHDYADRTDDAALTPKPAAHGRDAYELRLGSGPDALRWLVEEQVDIDAGIPTRPDFLFTRQDEPAPQVALYLDGFSYHATNEHNRLADDAEKRDSLRANGFVVWNLTWDDVNAFRSAITAEVMKHAPDRPLLDAAAVSVVQEVQHRRGGVLPAGTAWRNPVAVLFELLRVPRLDDWNRLACSVVAGLARQSATSEKIDRSQVVGWLRAVFAGGEPNLAEHHDIVAFRFVPDAGLQLIAMLDAREPHGPNAERWTAFAVLADDAAAIDDERGHPIRWRDWLSWCNILQFLRGDHGGFVMTTTSASASVDLGDLVVVPASAPSLFAAPPTPVLIDLELLGDAERVLVGAAVELGAPVPEIGNSFGPGGWMLEAAWEGPRVAVLVGDDTGRDQWLNNAGWDARPTAGWTAESLAAAVAGDA